MTDETIRVIENEIASALPEELVAYLEGASRDGYRSKQHNTLRIAQRDVDWLHLLQRVYERLGVKSWMYREGTRNVWVLESSWRGSKGIGAGSAASTGFARGYFDAEGGVPRDPSSRFYVQLCQKDHSDLEALRVRINSLGIATGIIHNPSQRVDPAYWRFYVRASSWDRFISEVGSWHPRKRPLLDLHQSQSRKSS